MIIVDTALRKLQEEGKPIRVGMIGAGFMGRGIAVQICKSVPGMQLVAISNRTLSKAAQIYRDAGVTEVYPVETTAELEDNIRKGRFSIMETPDAICEADGIDAVIEATGAVEFAARLQDILHLLLVRRQRYGHRQLPVGTQRIAFVRARVFGPMQQAVRGQEIREPLDNGAATLRVGRREGIGVARLAIDGGRPRRSHGLVQSPTPCASARFRNFQSVVRDMPRRRAASARLPPASASTRRTRRASSAGASRLR